MKVTIKDIIDKLMEPVGQLESTVDTLRSGSLNTEVKGIVTTFMATHHVIEQAVAMGANLLITHEGTFYSHLDRTESLEKDPVYREKQRLIDESGIAIFRFHDYWHRYQPDGIMAGLIQALDWQSYVDDHQPAASILTVPAMTVKEIAEYAKNKLGISFVRVAGDLSITCTRVGLLAGYRGGGALAIPLFENEHLDLIISGEGPEWETPEYVRDAVHQGRKMALIVLGHAESEVPGMKHLAERIGMMFPTIPVHFIPGKQIFQVI
ncbi:Nif3-like dinuclear metal center hexameric protein [Paenibacillus sedimenti]|uniref:GTP cyclohydrolase 1 type 2 homolog n=1 Tax=Paenibacillus sedimenti TaxID=2770274 RepID=A0A926QMF2_9BACL|nr:Nif3-like dinuclear metal center hexameric protein [Paenibacillus sedimenti]MBD0383622.1 Nif3-like dinuclear metal center hexameric protein [Paenibacillus sedimenti]